MRSHVDLMSLAENSGMRRPSLSRNSRLLFLFVLGWELQVITLSNKLSSYWQNLLMNLNSSLASYDTGNILLSKRSKLGGSEQQAEILNFTWILWALLYRFWSCFSLSSGYNYKQFRKRAFLTSCSMLICFAGDLVASISLSIENANADKLTHLWGWVIIGLISCVYLGRPT